MPEENLDSSAPLPELRPILGVGTCNDATFYLLTQRNRPDSQLDDQWTVLEITEHSLSSGGFLRPGPLASIPLDGRLGPTDIYVSAVPLSITKLLFAVTVTEGKYDEEEFFYHGYLVECSSLRSSVTRVFRISYDGANLIPSITKSDSKLYIVSGSELFVLDQDTFETESKMTWPDDPVKNPHIAFVDGHIYAFQQVNLVDTPIDKALKFDVDGGTSEWVALAPDSEFGRPNIQWHKSHGCFAQFEATAYAHSGGVLWSTDLSERSPRWSQVSKGKAFYTKPGRSDQLFADGSGNLFLIAQDYSPKRIVAVNRDDA